METLIPNRCFFEFKSTATSRSNPSPNPLKTLSFVQFPNRKWRAKAKNLVFASNSMRYGGWDDLASIEDSSRGGKFDQLNDLLVSLGVDDRKDVVLFVVGFASAFAISRVRVSSVLVFPCSVLVFAVGFLFGFVRAGDVGASTKSKVDKDEIFRVYNEKLKEFVGVFGEIGMKMGNLQKEMVEFIESNHLEDVVLYKSARILSRAIAMKPLSLLAVGQLGNTYLLHGELKLRISRNLRTVLSRTDSLPKEEISRIQVKGLDEQVMSRDAVASILVDVCEECEELLVAAGRRYKTALSIDGNDARALYNWGLALYYRAQLIADIGPGAAFDADKVYLAAIDKFDAMMSKSNVHAPDALFRWGMTLQQRSRLRPRNSKEKVKLLYQAKRLFEDVLSMDSDNLQVREALLSCMSELNYTNF
ncbi:hypothetical protein Syun_008397 [Stephania yunnanensis]|uniref:Uncharacterized protein n=1 Tax=Stephania yunnanensis TaxID=152371 RepID=A0AAP0KCJ7_9MAGN